MKTTSTTQLSYLLDRYTFIPGEKDSIDFIYTHVCVCVCVCDIYVCVWYILYMAYWQVKVNIIISKQNVKGKGRFWLKKLKS